MCLFIDFSLKSLCVKKTKDTAQKAVNMLIHPLRTGCDSNPGATCLGNLKKRSPDFSGKTSGMN